MECDKQFREYAVVHIDRPFPAGNPEGGIDFTLRGLTSKETAMVMLDAGMDDKRTILSMRMSDHKAVYCGLGGNVKIGSEGWSIDRPLTIEAVEMLTDEAVMKLSSEIIALTYPAAEQVKN